MESQERGGFLKDFSKCPLRVSKVEVEIVLNEFGIYNPYMHLYTRWSLINTCRSEESTQDRIQ